MKAVDALKRFGKAWIDCSCGNGETELEEHAMIVDAMDELEFIIENFYKANAISKKEMKSILAYYNKVFYRYVHFHLKHI